MPRYFRWISDGPDLVEALSRKKLQYTNNGKHSDKAFFVFDMEMPYRPQGNFWKERFLVEIVFNESGQSILDSTRHIDFEEIDFDGEAGHPDEIIVKSNEEGAYGIGKNVLQQVSNMVSTVSLAGLSDIAKALGESELNDGPKSVSKRHTTLQAVHSREAKAAEKEEKAKEEKRLSDAVSEMKMKSKARKKGDEPEWMAKQRQEKAEREAKKADRHRASADGKK